MKKDMLFERIFHRERLSIKHVFSLFSFIFVVWAFYRYFPEILPTWIEELILKPIIWLLPTFWLVKKIEKENLSSLGFTKKNFFPSLYWGIGLGLVFAFEGFMANSLKYGKLRLPVLGYGPAGFLEALFISFVTAFSEETVFRGYIFTRLRRLWKKDWLAGIVSSLLFVLIHLPVGVFVLGYTPLLMLVYFLFVFIFGVGSAFVFTQSENIFSSILLHVFWSWPIVLFK